MEYWAATTPLIEMYMYPILKMRDLLGKGICNVCNAYPTAAERVCFPVAKMIVVLSADTTVAPSLRKSATSWAKHLRIRLATVCCNSGDPNAEAGLHNHLHKFFKSSSAYLQKYLYLPHPCLGDYYQITELSEHHCVILPLANCVLNSSLFHCDHSKLT